jgi:hypothetical protein
LLHADRDFDQHQTRLQGLQRQVLTRVKSAMDQKAHMIFHDFQDSGRPTIRFLRLGFGRRI